MKFLYSIALAFLFISCGSTTSITGTWKNEELPKNQTYESVFIVAMTGNMAARTLIEDEIAFYAEKNGNTAIKSHKVFPATFSQSNAPTKEQILEIIRDTGADAIFTVALKNQESETRYVPGTTNYAYGYRPLTYGYYGNFYGYYNTMYPTVYDPGHYTTDKVYYLESNLYDATTEELLWSAQSETYNPSGIEQFTQDYTEALVKALVGDGLLPKQ